MDKEAPMKNIQTRTKYTKWLTDSTKVAMAHRQFERHGQENSGR